MSYPLHDSLWEISDRVVRSPHVLLCLSLDGTLMSATEMKSARLPAAMLKTKLRTLSRRGNVTLAFISSHDRARLQASVALPGVIYAGNHGLEISAPGSIFIQPGAAISSEMLTCLAEDLRRALQHVPGVDVVDQGLSLSVRFRLADPEQWDHVRQITRETFVRNRCPIDVTLGEDSIDLRPVVAWTRGIAVSWMQQEIDQPDALVIYAGDVGADEEVFATHPEGITMRIGSAAWSAAHYSVADSIELLDFFEWLDVRLREKARPKTSAIALEN